MILPESLGSRANDRRARASRPGELKRTWSHALFGYDAFISYRRSDATVYASLLASRLERELDFVVFLDNQEFEVGERLPVLLRDARRSRLLILLASPEVGRSKFVPQEVAAAHAKGRRVVPIDLHGTIAGGKAGPELEALLRDEKWEPEANLIQAGPSDAIVEAIARSSRGLRRRLQQRWFFGTVVATLLVLSLYLYWVAGQRAAALDRESVRAEESRRHAYSSQLLLANELAQRAPGRAQVALEDHERCPLPLRDVTWGLIRSTCRRELWRAPDDWGRQRFVVFDPLPSRELIALSARGVAREGSLTSVRRADDTLTNETGTPVAFHQPSARFVTRGDDGSYALSSFASDSAQRARSARLLLEAEDPDDRRGDRDTLGGKAAVETAVEVAAAISTDGSIFAVAFEKEVQFWDLSTRRRIANRRFFVEQMGDEGPVDRLVDIVPSASRPTDFLALVTRDLEDGFYRAAVYRLSSNAGAEVIIERGPARAVALAVAPDNGRLALAIESTDADIGIYAGESSVTVYEKEGARGVSKRQPVPLFHHLFGRESISAIALSPDGDHLAMATESGLLRVANATTGEVESELLVGLRPASVQLARSGDHAATVSEEGRAAVHLVRPPAPVLTVDTGARVDALPKARYFHWFGQAGAYRWTGILPDNEMGGVIGLPSAGRPDPTGETSLWLELDENSDLGRVQTDWIPGAVAVHPELRWMILLDGTRLQKALFAPESGRSRVAVERPDSEPQQEPLGDLDDVVRIALSVDGKHLAIVRLSPEAPESEESFEPVRSKAGPWLLTIVDTTDGEVLAEPWRGMGLPSDLSWSPDGKWVALALASGDLELFDAGSWTVRRTIEGDGRAKASFSRDRRSLAVISQVDVSAALLSIVDLERDRVETMSIPAASVTTLLQPSDSRVVLGAKDGSIAIVDVPGRAIRRAAGPFPSQVIGLEASHDGKTLLVTRLLARGSLRCTLVDAEFGHDLLELQMSGQPARAATFLPRGAGVLMVGPDESVYRWTAETAGRPD